MLSSKPPARAVICLDANLGERTVEVLRRARPAHPPLLHWNQHPSATGARVITKKNGARKAFHGRGQRHRGADGGSGGTRAPRAGAEPKKVTVRAAVYWEEKVAKLSAKVPRRTHSY